jgi:RimJ/RimL family protein N-acetyltransferase
MTSIVITTERLLLTPLGMDDARALLAYRSDPAVCRYQTWAPGALDEVERFIANLEEVEFDAPGTWFQLGIRLGDPGPLVGDLGVHFPAGEPRQAEIGFTVAPEHQRRGIGAEAVEGLLGHLFGPLRKHRVFASVDPRNAASVGLLRRIGMRQEAHFRESAFIRGDWVDDLVFAMLRSEWEQR